MEPVADHHIDAVSPPASDGDQRPGFEPHAGALLRGFAGAGECGGRHDDRDRIGAVDPQREPRVIAVGCDPSSITGLADHEPPLRDLQLTRPRRRNPAALISDA